MDASVVYFFLPFFLSCYTSLYDMEELKRDCLENGSLTAVDSRIIEVKLERKSGSLSCETIEKRNYDDYQF